MDFNTQLFRALKTGTVVLGPVLTGKCIREGKARMVVVAGNCPSATRAKISRPKSPFIHTFSGSGLALGNLCRKPFSVSMLAIISPGESDILSFIRS